MTIMTKAKTNRQSIESRLIAAQDSLLSLKHDHGTAALAAAQDGREHDPQLDALELEILATERTIRRLEAAALAQAASETEASRQARRAARQQARKQVDLLGQSLKEIALEMVDRIEELAPLVARFDAISLERKAVAAEVTRGHTMTPEKFERCWASVAPRAALRAGHVPSAVLATLWRTGISRVLAVEQIGAVLPAPDYVGPYGQGDIHQALAKSLDETQRTLGVELDRVLEKLQ